MPAVCRECQSVNEESASRCTSCAGHLELVEVPLESDAAALSEDEVRSVKEMLRQTGTATSAAGVTKTRKPDELDFIIIGSARRAAMFSEIGRRLQRKLVRVA